MLSSQKCNVTNHGFAHKGMSKKGLNQGLCFNSVGKSSTILQ